MRNYTIPAPPHSVCNYQKCGRVVDQEIVRFNGRFYHISCFAMWFPTRRRKAQVQIGAGAEQTVVGV